MKTVKSITGLPDYFFTPDKLEAYKDANLLKGGLVYADAITTVIQNVIAIRFKSIKHRFVINEVIFYSLYFRFQYSYILILPVEIHQCI